MSDQHGTDVVEDGIGVTDVVDRLDDREDRTTLDRVAEDGTLTPAGLRSAAARCSKVISTAETRAELASIAVEDAREAADAVADVPVVRSRTAALESRLDAVTDEADALGAEFDAVLDRVEAAATALDSPADPPVEALADAADGLATVRTAANRTTRAADDLKMDAESFEQWLQRPGRRRRELATDVEEFEESVVELARVVDTLEDGATGGEDPAPTWLDAAIRRRVLELVAADLRGELRDVAALADRDRAWTDDVEDDLAAAEQRLATLEERLSALEAAGHPDRLAAFEDDLAAADPPVDWARVFSLVEEYRPTPVESP